LFYLDEAVGSLTREIHAADDHEKRLKIPMDIRGVGLPMATAILTVLYPDYFTVYDTRVRNQLGGFSNLGARSISTIWEDYEELRQAVREKAGRTGRADL